MRTELEMRLNLNPNLEPVTVISTSPCTEFFGCNVLLIATLLAWFSVVYSSFRVGSMCSWLLHHSYEDEEDPDSPEKNCLWGIAGVILITYELILSFVLCIGTGSFVFDIKGFFLLIWCVNYPVFLTLHWVLGFFLTKCCSAQLRMKRTSSYNCIIVITNIFWRALLYWCALTVLIHFRSVNSHLNGGNSLSGTAESLSS